MQNNMKKRLGSPPQLLFPFFKVFFFYCHPHLKNLLNFKYIVIIINSLLQSHTLKLINTNKLGSTPSHVLSPPIPFPPPYLKIDLIISK